MAYRDKKRKTISAIDRTLVFKRDGYICGYCGKKKKAGSLAVDHIIPVRHRGYHGMKNWVTSCKQCNRKKWLYVPKENGSPKLLFLEKRKVVKVTIMAKGKKFIARFPKLSFSKNES